MEQNQEVLVRCKRGSDRITDGQSCKGTIAKKLSEDGSPIVRFQCTTCNFVWSIPIGGSFSL